MTRRYLGAIRLLWSTSSSLGSVDWRRSELVWGVITVITGRSRLAGAQAAGTVAAMCRRVAKPSAQWQQHRRLGQLGLGAQTQLHRPGFNKSLCTASSMLMWLLGSEASAAVWLLCPLLGRASVNRCCGCCIGISFLPLDGPCKLHCMHHVSAAAWMPCALLDWVTFQSAWAFLERYSTNWTNHEQFVQASGRFKTVLMSLAASHMKGQSAYVVHLL